MIANRPSETALIILRSLVLQARDPALRALVPAGWNSIHERLLRAADPRGAERWIRQSGSPYFRRAAHFLAETAFPGLPIHYILRKRFIEDIARACIAKDVTQVVSIGSGYDSLCHRLHWEFPGVNFFELDHPATQALKRHALEDVGFSSSLQLLPIDLRQAILPDCLLAEPGFDRSARTLFIAEGVMMYLDANVISSLLEAVSTHSGPGSCFCFTFIENAKEVGSPLLRHWLRYKDEPMVWTASCEELEQVLAAYHLEIDEIADAETLDRAYLRPAGVPAPKHPVAEKICVAFRP